MKWPVGTQHLPSPGWGVQMETSVLAVGAREVGGSREAIPAMGPAWADIPGGWLTVSSLHRFLPLLTLLLPWLLLPLPIPLPSPPSPLPPPPSSLHSRAPPSNPLNLNLEKKSHVIGRIEFITMPPFDLGRRKLGPFVAPALPVLRSFLKL